MTERQNMKNPSPLVSICIPAYQSHAFIGRALESCIRQTYEHIEVIVVDNASTDQTREVVLEYAAQDKRIKYFRNETNMGSGNNYLKAFQRASGTFMQALGSDDWLSETYVEECLKQFEKYPDAAAICSDIVSYTFDAGTEILHLRDTLSLREGVYSADWFFRGIYMGHAVTGYISFMRRKDLLEAQTKMLRNPVNWLSRGERKEPFDMPIFLEVLAKYRYFVFTKKAAYLKTVHSESQVGLQGGYGSPEGRARYATATRKAYESFFLEHNLRKHWKRLRICSGLSILANIPRTWMRQRVNAREWKSYMNEVAKFFMGYTIMEKVFLLFLFIPYILWKAILRI